MVRYSGAFLATYFVLVETLLCLDLLAKDCLPSVVERLQPGLTTVNSIYGEAD